jgi:hypothetical protein
MCVRVRVHLCVCMHIQTRVMCVKHQGEREAMMYTYIYIYIYMYVCIYVYVYVYVYIHTYIHRSGRAQDVICAIWDA